MVMDVSLTFQLPRWADEYWVYSFVSYCAWSVHWFSCTSIGSLECDYRSYGSAVFARFTSYGNTVKVRLFCFASIVRSTMVVDAQSGKIYTLAYYCSGE